MQAANMIKQEAEETMNETAMASEPVPRPIEGLHEIPAPPFLTKTYEMVDDQATDDVVSWSTARNSFVVWDSNKFSTTLLPRYFKHGNFSSFIRQLNTYGFRKVDPDKWEFANEGFLGGQKHLLKTIKRRRHGVPNVQRQGGASACVEVGQYGLEGVLERLKRDCSVLMTEIVRLKQQHHESREYIVAMQNRLSTAERKQQQIMGFLAKAMNNPVFIQQFMLETAERKALDRADMKRKRRLTASASTCADNFREQIENLADHDDSVGHDHDVIVNIESEFHNLFGAGVETDSSNNVKVQLNESVARTGESNLDSVNEMLWDELLAGNLELDNVDDEQLSGDFPETEDLGGHNSSEWGEEDLQDLVDQIDYFNSKP